MEIEDQGIGVPQNEYHKIFQRFYRGSSKEVMEKSGTGIGLFLSRENLICWLNFESEMKSLQFGCR